MSSDAAHTVMTAASGDIATATTPASLTDAPEAITGLPDHLVVEHILRSEYFDDPADLARLPAVSRAMRDAVAATGLRFEELSSSDAARLGCLSAAQRLQRGGRLWALEDLCMAAARGGHLEELKVLRASGWPWDTRTCASAAARGHLEVLQWLRVNGCPWNRNTCAAAAYSGHLNVLQWARANGAPWDEETCKDAAEGRYLDILRWARTNGCPWTEATRRKAAQLGYVEQ